MAKVLIYWYSRKGGKSIESLEFDYLNLAAKHVYDYYVQNTYVEWFRMERYKYREFPPVSLERLRGYFYDEMTEKGEVYLWCGPSSDHAGKWLYGHLIVLKPRDWGSVEECFELFEEISKYPYEFTSIETLE